MRFGVLGHPGLDWRSGEEAMANALDWFEIPTADLERAIRFYESVLAVSLKREVFGGVPMAMFPNDDKSAGGAYA